MRLRSRFHMAGPPGPPLCQQIAPRCVTWTDDLARIALTPVHPSQALLEAALRAQHARIGDLAAQYDSLSQAVKGHAQHSAETGGERERLRCSLGEVCRLLRQAKHAETELKQACCRCHARGRGHVAVLRRAGAQAAAFAPQDVLVRRQWDRYFSGEETRDVLEVRR